ncbi:ATP-dependent RNA helicase DHX33-like isoform X2 [Dendronephthya gigantea]|uniref:ATP-dependent RNA helicase DHX33-like isoform X2 n=1 Tax=Dendronephthya gigantea TaxID=151771 RepID=UPI00106ACD3A|nr:ATP-dependent RNA helicase DHX33-like isoform X2 [Dendronephthya gigantea]
MNGFLNHDAAMSCEDSTSNGVQQEDERLPISRARKALVREAKHHQSLIIIGETASGKSTQLPQYLYRSGFARLGVIGCTQPRRVAAISIAERVAREMKEELGGKIGYSVRFEDVSSPNTRIKYMTDGMLLREAISDPLLKRYGVIILDEAHERTVHTDVLFGIVKTAQRNRNESGGKPLKVIVMSATLEAEPFSKFFGGAKILYIEGRQHPIKTFYAAEQQTDYLHASLTAAVQLHNEQPLGGHILIFLTGQEEIELLANLLKDCLNEYNPNTGLDILRVQPVSMAQARQRLGRAGRQSPGQCYRLYTEEQFYSLQSSTTPEIQRCNLASVVLQLKALGIKDVGHFEFLDSPLSKAIENAVDQLTLLGALGEDGGELTGLGRNMARFPLEPRFSKTLLMSRDFNCSEDVLTIIALLSVDTIFYTPPNRRDSCNAVLQKYRSAEGDHIMLLNIYRAFKAVRGNKEWCENNFINSKAMKTVLDIRTQLREICTKLEIPLQSCGKDTSKIRECLTTGFFVNAAELQLDGSYKCFGQKMTASIHPSSSLFKAKPAYVVFTELVHTSKCYMRHVAVVDPQWLVSIAPAHFRKLDFHGNQFRSVTS